MESNLFKYLKEDTLVGRYINRDMIKPLLNALPRAFEKKVLGYSVEQRPIEAIYFGNGKHRILMWSQMHGNEGTTTKAVFDLICSLNDPSNEKVKIDLFDTCTICIIPMLNPDGAIRHTRNNANDIDLNRDATKLSQPESVILRSVFEEFKPNYCFNLHDQRSIYGFEKTKTPSVVSFLSPSASEDCGITISRKQSMAIIANIYSALNAELPDQIGRYDDTYNINCVGDYFQTQEVPTILFEAGHYPKDYQREKTRRFITQAIWTATSSIINNELTNHNAYFEIPEHQKCYVDILVKNAKLTPSKMSRDVLFHFEEKIENGQCIFKAALYNDESNQKLFGHRDIDAGDQQILNLKGEFIINSGYLEGISIGNELTITF